MRIPEIVCDVINSYLTSELVYFDGKYPIATPVATFLDMNRNSIVFSTSVSFYKKVECIKRNPNVSLLYSKHDYSGFPEKLIVLIHGTGKIREDNFEENTAYFSELVQRQKDTWKKKVYIKMGEELDSFVGRFLMDWYMLRILIEILPYGAIYWGKKGVESIGDVEDVCVQLIPPPSHDAVLAFMGKRYPVAIPVRVKPLDGEFLIIDPRELKNVLKTKQKSSLLFHKHNEYVKNIFLVRYKGLLLCENENVRFVPESKYSFKQGGILNYIRFILEGKRRAKKFMRKRMKD